MTIPVQPPRYLGSMNTSPIAQTLASLVIGPEVTFNNLVMFPLLRNPESENSVEPSKPRRTRRNPAEPERRRTKPNPAEPRRTDWYHVLDDAIASGAVEVTEVSEHGSVPELRVVNRAAKPTLIIDGEELVGAKQNRVVNLTILVAAHSNLTIPVSCVEAGRWRARSRAFAAAPRTQYATGRAKRMAQVTQSMLASSSYYSDQAEVWSDIAHKAAQLRSTSPTGAMESIFTDHAMSIDSFVSALQPVDGQVGAMFAIGGRVVGLDLFDTEKTLRKLLAKLVRSAAVEALDTDAGQASLPGISFQGVCEQFLAAVANAPSHTSSAVGVGEDVRLTTHGLTGAALVVEHQVVHLSAFAM